MDLINELFSKTEKLSPAISRLKKHGIELAEAEKDYKIALRQEALKLRNEQNMPVTLIHQTIYGLPQVADYRLKRDIAEVMYKTAQEYINTLKLEIRIIQNQVDKEWGNSK